MPDFTRKEGKPSGDFRSDSDFLLGYFEEKDGALLYRYEAERVLIEPWGENSLRVRAAKMPVMPSENWALSEEPKKTEAQMAVLEEAVRAKTGAPADER